MFFDLPFSSASRRFPGGRASHRIRPAFETLGERCLPSTIPLVEPLLGEAVQLDTGATTPATAESFHASGLVTTVNFQGNRRFGPVEGTSTQLGSFTGDLAAVVKRLGNDETAKGTLRLVSADGVQLVLSFVIVRNRGEDSFVGTYSVVEGTGRFEGARGTGAMTLTPHTDGTATFAVDGELGW